MYYIAVKNPNGTYSIDEIVEDWHKAVKNYEPIDCINGEVLIYDEQGHKFLVGPQKNLEKKKLFWKISTVDVGSWDFSKGEPFLIDTKKTNKVELNKLLKSFSSKTKHS